MRRQTPWGPADYSKRIAEGITVHSTSSHGGMELSGYRHTKLQEKFPFPTFAGGPWYEEDCDVCAVVIAFHDVFPPSHVYEAYKMASAMTTWNDPEEKWNWVVQYADNHPEIPGIVEAERAIKENLWSRGSSFTDGNGWVVSLSRKGERIHVKTGDYPEKHYYADEEIAQWERV